MKSQLFDLLDATSNLFGDVYVRELLEEYADSRYGGEWKLKKVADKIDYSRIDVNMTEIMAGQ